MNDDTRLVIESAERFLSANYSFDQRSGLIDSVGKKITVLGSWPTFTELGWTGIGIPESSGGIGTLADMFELLRVLGGGLVVEPLSSALIGAHLLALFPDHTLAAKCLSSSITGDLRIIPALNESRYGFGYEKTETVVTSCKDGFRLDGKKSLILDGDCATSFIISAREKETDSASESSGLFILNRDTKGLSVSNFSSTDDRQLCSIAFNDVFLSSESRLTNGESALEAISLGENLRAASASADALGVMQVLLSQTVDYSREREQFGKAIGSFQALQHKMADMFMAVERAKSMFTMMCDAFNQPFSQTDLTRAVSMARVEICDSARLVGQHAVQIHGGIGITDELAASHYFKRLTASQFYGGDSTFHLGKYLTLRNSKD